MANFVDGGKVIKYTPPPPLPDRPALGANIPARPSSHGYHGDPKNTPAQETAPSMPIQSNPQEQT